MSEDQFIAGIFNYCDRWCERCAFTSRCRVFADEGKYRAADGQPAANEEFWSVLDDVAEEAMQQEWEISDVELDDVAAREARLDEETERDPLVRLSHVYSFAAHRWLQLHDDISRNQPFTAQRDAVTPAEAMEVIGWHAFQITAKLSRATRGCLEAVEEEGEEDDSWDIGSTWQDEEDDIDMAEIHRHDAEGSARVALLGIERSIGAWSILRGAFAADEPQILMFIKQLARMRRMLDETLPGARTFRRPGFDD